MTGDVDRKKLWGRSGERCAFCNTVLTSLDGLDAIVGDEAHIRSPKPEGPRYDADYPQDVVDRYENLVLLCKAHHKLIDDNVEVFPADLLTEMKARHERRVAAALDPPSDGWQGDILLEEVLDGTRLMALAHGAVVFSIDNDHPATDAEWDTVPPFLQSLTDWAELSDEIGPAGRGDAARDLDQQLAGLHDLGFAALAASASYRHPVGGVMRGLIVRAVRRSSLDHWVVDLDEEPFPEEEESP